MEFVVKNIEDASKLFSHNNNDNTRISEGNLVIYVDGSCVGNGTDKSNGEIGIYFRENCKYNISEKLVEESRPFTNNICELTAAIRALEISNVLGYSKIEIRTDCKLLFDYFRNIRNKRRDEVRSGREFRWRYNDDLYSELTRVVITKVRGHGGAANNQMADQLAKSSLEN